MSYLTYTRSDVEAMIGNVAVQVLNAVEQVRQVQAFVTGLDGGPTQALTDLGFTAEQVTKILTAYSTSTGLVKIADVFDGDATLTAPVEFKSNVLAVVGPSLY